MIIFEKKKLMRGVELLAEAVSKSHGPSGGTVLIERMGGLLPTKDGYAIACDMQSSDPEENMGLQILRQACEKVNRLVGDGTTTTALLANALIKNSEKWIVAGHPWKKLMGELEVGIEKICNYLLGEAWDVSEIQGSLESIAQGSSNYDEDLSTSLLKACREVGKYGSVFVEEGKKIETEVSIREGFEFERGMCDYRFSTDFGNRKAEYKGPLVVLAAMKIETIDQITPILEEVSKFHPRPVIILAYGFSAKVREIMWYNGSLLNSRNPRPIHSCGILVPGINEGQKLSILKDIAAMSGATLVDPNAGMILEKFKSEYMGAFYSADISMEKSNFVFYEEHSEKIHERVKFLSQQKKNLESPYEIEKLEKRIASMTESLAIVRVGGYTEVELKEKRARVEDTLAALQSALRKGVVHGGGVAYIDSLYFLDSEVPGEKLLRLAIYELLKSLFRQKKVTVEDVIEKCESGLFFDVRENRFRRKYVEPMVCDPVEVPVEALRAAFSVAKMIISTDVLIF